MGLEEGERTRRQEGGIGLKEGGGVRGRARGVPEGDTLGPQLSFNFPLIPQRQKLNKAAAPTRDFRKEDWRRGSLPFFIIQAAASPSCRRPDTCRVPGAIKPGKGADLLYLFGTRQTDSPTGKKTGHQGTEGGAARLGVMAAWMGGEGEDGWEGRVKGIQIFEWVESILERKGKRR